MENNGAQQLASEATVFIVLEDVNDEIPLFTEREQVKSCSIFGGSINLLLGCPKFFFDFKNSQDDLDRSRALELLIQGQYIDEVSASHFPIIALKHSAFEFGQCEMTTSFNSLISFIQERVLEGEPPGTLVTRTNAIDKDGTFPNNQVYYYIKDNSEGAKYFKINSQTGEISTKMVKI